ncbi:ribbon-helix-helix domain-containing protein [Paludibacterium denitrificans]|uniref:Ribbon-helix-helix domain-containing protein n=1 Tax=Paludibacterium denitrificans TaxID=2675226 RepID=A0A844GE65_9NEIS|nr:ribbon-helix-helix domain-containing protein [Paludibacterium denitrificans]MTD33610.1 ribbon-helix-helix domain-containing protein [Paludibacterium denitrificans]
MVVTPRKTAPSVDAFIGGAPDAGTGASAPVAAKDDGSKTIRKAGKKNIITVSIDPNVLEELDAYSNEMGMSRAAVITYAVKKLLKAY